MIGTKADRVQYCEAWAQMMVEIWVEKCIAYNIKDTGEFMESFMYDVREGANGDIDKIVHVYNYYGRMVDMGVGNRVNFDHVKSSNRKPKPWYDDTYWRSVKVLTEKMAELYGQNFFAVINENMNSTTSKIQY